MMMATMIAALTLLLAACPKHSITGLDEDDQIVIWHQNILKSEDVRKEQKTLPPSHSYTFFLFPQTKWLEGSRKRDIADLYQAYKDYGKVISDDNLAVWFWDSKKEWEPNTVIASDFIIKLNQGNYGHHLDINGGPFIVYLRTSEPQSISITEYTRGGINSRSVSRIQLEKLMTLASEGSVSDLFVLDLQQCGMEGTQKVLHWMETYIRNGHVSMTPDVMAAYRQCQIEVSGKKFGNLYKQVLAELKVVLPIIKEIAEALPSGRVSSLLLKRRLD